MPFEFCPALYICNLKNRALALKMPASRRELFVFRQKSERVKNLSLAINIVLLLAVGYLLINHFSGGAKNAPADASGTAAPASGAIAYIDVDTLYAYYDMYKDMKADLERRGKQASADLEGRVAKFAKKRDQFVKMAQAGLLSKNEMEKREAEIVQEGQEVERYQMSVQQGFASLEQEKQEALYVHITEFLEEYNKEKGYAYILGFQPGNVVWHAHKSYDVTMDVVEQLNARYKAKKDSGEAGE
jgi:outer membrane protein